MQELIFIRLALAVCQVLGVLILLGRPKFEVIVFLSSICAVRHAFSPFSRSHVLILRNFRKALAK